MTTFTYIPSYSALLKQEPKVVSVKFGDGYEQRVQFGINQNPRKWDLAFNGKTASQATAIDNFLKAANGVSYFDWTPPIGSAGKFICRGWNISLEDADIYSITATFEEVFDL